MDARLPVVSLFSGAGGLDLAAERCGETSSPGTDSCSTPGPLRVAVATDYDSPALATLPRTRQRRRRCALISGRQQRPRFLKRGVYQSAMQRWLSAAPVYPVQQVRFLARRETDEH